MLQASIAEFESQLIQFVEAGDWAAAERATDRLKTLLLTATIDDDADAIARITSILADAGERLELHHRLRLPRCDAIGTAWKLRSDAGTGILAMRLRPSPPKMADEKGYEVLADAIIHVLRGANRPMNNKQIAARVQRDEPIVSRTLKKLAAQGKVLQWKHGPRVFNTLVEPKRFEPVQAIRHSRETLKKNYADYFSIKPAKFDNDVVIDGGDDRWMVDAYVQAMPVGPTMPVKDRAIYSNFLQVKDARNR